MSDENETQNQTGSSQPQAQDDDFMKLFKQYKWVIPFIAIVVVVAMVGCTLGGAYNSLVVKDTTVQIMQGNVQTALERRADLIPNYVKTIEGSSLFEHDTLTDIAEMRASANKITENVKASRTVDDVQKNQDQLGAVIGRLMMLTEQYPTLKTTDQYKELEAQLAATENQINEERNNYNKAVMDYKTTVRAFPTGLIAGPLGFHEDKWEMFQASQQKQEVPDINFGAKYTTSGNR